MLMNEYVVFMISVSNYLDMLNLGFLFSHTAKMSKLLWIPGVMYLTQISIKNLQYRKDTLSSYVYAYTFDI